MQAHHVNKNLLTALCLVGCLTTWGQSVEFNETKEVSVNNGSSYYFNGYVKLLPGFTASATSPTDLFFCRYENIVNQPVGTDKNFFRIETALFPTTSEGTFSTFTVDKKQTTYSYSDGAGRPTQDIVVKGSALQKDIVSFNAYDSDGWKTKMYLPYVSSSNTGSFKPNFATEHETFYIGGAQKVSNDARPFSEHSTVEKSPLARVKEAYGPGSSWYSAAKMVSTSFKINSTASPVKLWKINSSTGLPVSSSDYPVGTVIISQGIDEDGNTTSSLKDFRGNVVQTVVHATPELITYSVYDDFGRLRFVLPPEASSNLTPDQGFLDKWAFQYKYDERGRVIKQKNPGIDWVYYVYDPWDNLILTQDGVQRGKSPEEWTFTRYDKFNRVIMTGVYKSYTTQDNLANIAKYWHTRYEERNASDIGYSTGAFPPLTSSDEILTLTYYDDYYFLTLSGWDAENNNLTFQNDALFPEPQSSAVKGNVTGSKIRIPGSNLWLNSVRYYDKYYRSIQSVQEHHLGGTDRVFTEYNFPGWVLENKRIHTSSAGSVTIVEEFEYDHAGRLLKNYHTINGGTRVLMASNAYNELGQLVETNTHSTDQGTTFLQSTDFRYNIRGSLTHINNSNLSNDNGITNDDNNDLFGMQFVYQDETLTVNGTTTQPKYNGPDHCNQMEGRQQKRSTERKGVRSLL